jgi:hypothetical protein
MVTDVIQLYKREGEEKIWNGRIGGGEKIYIYRTI